GGVGSSSGYNSESDTDSSSETESSSGSGSEEGGDGSGAGGHTGQPHPQVVAPGPEALARKGSGAHATMLHDGGGHCDEGGANGVNGQSHKVRVEEERPSQTGDRDTGVGGVDMRRQRVPVEKGPNVAGATNGHVHMQPGHQVRQGSGEQEGEGEGGGEEQDIGSGGWGACGKGVNRGKVERDSLEEADSCRGGVGPEKTMAGDGDEGWVGSVGKRGQKPPPGRSSLHGHKGAATKGGLVVGMKVLVRGRKGGKWKKALLGRQHGDGTWKVRYSGGMEERHVNPSRMRPRNASAA
ncbi:unnamed protein product, partial [Discosporangium mesarthrocarpum]